MIQELHFKCHTDGCINVVDESPSWCSACSRKQAIGQAIIMLEEPLGEPYNKPSAVDSHPFAKDAVILLKEAYEYK